MQIEGVITAMIPEYPFKVVSTDDLEQNQEIWHLTGIEILGKKKLIQDGESETRFKWSWDILKTLSRFTYHETIFIQQIIDNQKLGLCEGLLNQGDWEHAKQLIDKLPTHSAVSNPSVAKALCALVTKLIDPLYRK